MVSSRASPLTKARGRFARRTRILVLGQSRPCGRRRHLDFHDHLVIAGQLPSGPRACMHSPLLDSGSQDDQFTEDHWVRTSAESVLVSLIREEPSTSTASEGKSRTTWW